MQQKKEVLIAACPHCLRESWHVPKLDRYIHMDGSANARCWLALSRGEDIWRDDEFDLSTFAAMLAA